MSKIISFPKMYRVKVKEVRTRTYYVQAENELDAQEKYLLDGLTSDLYDKDLDRLILSAESTDKIKDE